VPANLLTAPPVEHADRYRVRRCSPASAYNPVVNEDTSRQEKPARAGLSGPRRAPFVGREPELATLRARLTRAAAGEGGVVLVAGEPGIGKTRLLAELGERARAAGWQVLSGRAYESEGMLPYLPVIEAVREYLANCPLDSLGVVLGRGAADVVRLVPEMRDYLPEVSEPSPLSPDAERFRLFESVTAFLLNIARSASATGTGLLVLLDDLHWADRPSILLLQHLARRLGDSPLLIVGSHRTVDLDATHPLADFLAELSREGLCEHARLSEFSLDEVREFIASAIGAAPAQVAVDAIHRETEGNPLFVREVVRNLLTEGLDLSAAQVAPTRWSIPEGVRQVIDRRLARLSPATNQMLQMGAVLGEGFSFDVLRSASDIEQGALVDALDSAVAAGMLREQQTGYEFTHALIRRTVYDGLSLPRRQQLHLRAAGAIEKVYGRNLTPHAASLAVHYRLAGAAAVEKALAYSQQAAEAARSVFAWEEAAVHLQAALELTDPGDAAMRCDLLLSLGEVLLAARNPTRVAQTVAPDAFALVEVLGDGRRATRACQIARVALYVYGGGLMAASPAFRMWAERADRWAAPGTIERVRADLALADALTQMGNYADAWPIRRRSIALARQLDDLEGLFDTVAQTMGRGVSPRHEPELLRLAEELIGRPRSGVPSRPLGWILSYSGWIFLNWGDRARAEALWRELSDLAALTRDPQLIVNALRLEIPLAVLDGDLLRAVSVGARVVTAANELGSPVLGWQWSANAVYRPLLHLGRADEALALADLPSVARAAGVEEPAFPNGGAPRHLCLAHRGHQAKARQLMRELVFERRWGTAAADAPTTALVTLLETAVLVEDREAASVLAERLAEVASLGVGWLALTCIARHLGAAATLLGDIDGARRYYEQALDVCARINFRPELALTRLARAELLLAQHWGARADALTDLDSAIAEFEVMGMQPALERARRLRQGMATAASSAPPPMNPDSLSEREVEVLRLLAEGKSNREIGAALVISLNTVERHINHIFQKTGVANRVAAARYADRHGLTTLRNSMP